MSRLAASGKRWSAILNAMLVEIEAEVVLPLGADIAGAGILHLIKYPPGEPSANRPAERKSMYYSLPRLRGQGWGGGRPA